MPFGRMPVGACAGAPRGTRALVLPGTLLPQMSQAPPLLWMLLQAAFPENELEADVGRAVVVDEAAAHRQHELAEQPQASERAEWQRGGGCAARGRMLGGAGGWPVSLWHSCNTHLPWQRRVRAQCTCSPHSCVLVTPTHAPTHPASPAGEHVVQSVC